MVNPSPGISRFLQTEGWSPPTVASPAPVVRKQIPASFSSAVFGIRGVGADLAEHAANSSSMPEHVSENQIRKNQRRNSGAAAASTQREQERGDGDGIFSGISGGGGIDRNTPAPTRRQPQHERGPTGHAYDGGFTGITWNAQALMPVDSVRRRRRGGC